MPEYLFVINGGEKEEFREYPDDRRATKGASNTAYNRQCRVSVYHVDEQEPFTVQGMPGGGISGDYRYQ